MSGLPKGSFEFKTSFAKGGEQCAVHRKRSEFGQYSVRFEFKTPLAERRRRAIARRPVSGFQHTAGLPIQDVRSSYFAVDDDDDGQWSWWSVLSSNLVGCCGCFGRSFE